MYSARRAPAGDAARLARTRAAGRLQTLVSQPTTPAAPMSHAGNPTGAEWYLNPTDKIGNRKRVMAWRMLFLLALGELLGMTLWFSATAVTPALISEFTLTTAQTAWLTMAVQGGFVCGTLISALLNLSDVVNARTLFALGCVTGALANAGVGWVSDPGTVILLRFMTGVALAVVYPPGMKIAASWFRDRRGTALGVVIGALTLGSAFPHLLASLSASLPCSGSSGRLLAWR